MPDPLQPIEVSQLALGEHVKAIAEALNTTPSWVYRFIGTVEHDPYSRFLAVHKAAAKVNPPGADLYAQDFQARHVALTTKGMAALDWDKAVIEAMELTQSALIEAMQKGGEFEVKVTKAINSLRKLLIQTHKEP